MPIPPPRTRIDLAEVVRLQEVEGLNTVQIAKRLGFRPASVRAALRRADDARKPERAINAVEHGRALHRVWKSVHERCSNPRHPLHARFGARGYSVCSAWRTFWPFYDWALASGYRSQASLEIPGRSRTFSPKACRWVSLRERMQREGGPPGRRPIRFITALGETKSLSEWARDPRCKVKAVTLWARLKKGVPSEQAVTLPSSVRSLPTDRRRVLRTRAYQRLDWGEVVRLREEEGLAITEIARRVGASYEHVRRGLKARKAQSPKPPLHRDALRETFTTMHQRCSDEQATGYRYYGARGARVCTQWTSFEAFHAWALDAGYRPGLCLTRRRGTRIYSPENCRWVTRQEARHRARAPKESREPIWTVRAFGETKGPAEWTRDPRCRVSLSGLIQRLRGGWRPEDAITRPPQGGPKDASKVLVTAFHQTKSVADWSRDRRCKVTAAGLSQRLRRGVLAEKAIAAPAYQLGSGNAETAEHAGRGDAPSGPRRVRSELPTSRSSSYAPRPSPRPDATTAMPRRTADERIAELRAEIERIKAREAAQKVKKDPALRHISGAVRSIDKAASATHDKATRQALTEARATLAACLALNGAQVGSGGGSGRVRKPLGPPPDPGKVLAYLKKRPGSRSEDICAELGTDALALRPVLHQLRDEGKIVVEGKARATSYSAR